MSQFIFLVSGFVRVKIDLEFFSGKDGKWKFVLFSEMENAFVFFFSLSFANLEIGLEERL